MSDSGPGSRPDRRAFAAAGAVVLGAAVVLLAMGRSLWCGCGSLVPASWDVWSRHNSQHLLDPYSFSHFQHGLVFFGLLWIVGRGRWAGAKLVAAVLLEAAWEVLENTPMVIEHYRATTVSLDYYGDSVANSVSDLFACVAGYLVASRLPGWATLLVYVAIEVAMIAIVRDSLILNVLMLLWPLETVKQWQLGG